MNTPKTLIALMICGTLVVVPSALAIGQSFGGVVEYSADAEAHYGVNYQPILDKGDEGRAEAQATAESTIATVTSTVDDLKGQVESNVEAQKDNAVKVSAETQGSLLGDISDNLAAAGSWFASLWVKPSVDAPAASDGAAHATKDLAADMKPGYVGLDGKAHLDVIKDTRGAADLEYNLPPPPTPKASFGAALQLAIEEFFHLG